MSNRYCNLDGSKRISEDYTNINIGFDKVQGEMDTANQTASSHINNADIHVTKAQKTDWDSKAAGNHRHNNATAAADGFQSKEDKAKSDASTSAATANTLAQRDAAGRLKVAAPAATDDAARKAEVDAVQTDLNSHKTDTNIHVTKAKQDDWDSKAAGNHRHDNATTTADGFMSKEDKAKVNGIAAGAEVNQNAFAKVNDIPATGKSDTVTLKAGTGIAITTNPADKSVNITATGQSTPGPHASSHLSDGADPIPNATNLRSGLMSAQDKQDIDNIKTQINAVQLTKTLGPGANLINADQASALDMTVYGASRTNLLGDAGTIKDSNNDGLADGWSKAQDGTHTIVDGYQRIESKTTDTSINNRYITRNGSNTLFSVQSGKKYIALVDVVTDGSSQARLSMSLGSGNSSVAMTTTTSKTVYAKLAAVVDSGGYVTLQNINAVSVVGWVQFKDVDVLEVTDDALWNAIGTTITESNIRDYFPHVDRRQHVQGVVITNRGKNNFDGEIVQVNKASFTKLGVNSLEVTSETTTFCRADSSRIPVLPNTNYTISAVLTNVSGADIPRLSIRKGSNPGVSIFNNLEGEGLTSLTFNTANETEVVLYFYGNLSTGSIQKKRFERVQLELGSVATPFEPREDQRILLPVTIGEVGGVRDSVDIRGTEATHTKRVERGIVLDGNQTWSLHSQFSGYKRIMAASVYQTDSTKDSYLLKYNGAVLKRNDGAPPSEDYYSLLTGNVYVSISDAETGWVAGVTPSGNACKGLMNGWKATANDGSKYTSWVSILDGKAATTNTEAWVAANKAPGWTGWATLDYVLATPVISKVTDADGAISLHPGGNMITVESGAIFKEKLTFDPATKKGVTAKRSARILDVWKGIQREPYTTYTLNGQTLPQLVNAVDTNKQYFVSYMLLDKYAASANVTQTDVQYKAGLNATTSDNTNDIARLKAENDAQNFGLDYIQAGTMNNELDLRNHKASLTAHDAAAITNSDIINFPGMPKLTDVLAYLKLLASSLKSKVAGAIGAPLSATDTADQMETKINDLKTTFAANLTAKRVTAAATETLKSLIDKVATIVLGSGNATAGDLLAGKTATNDTGVQFTGTMPNNGAVNNTIASQNGQYTIPAGYHNGAGKVTANISGLTPSVIVAPNVVGGVTGTATIETLGGKRFRQEVITGITREVVIDLGWEWYTVMMYTDQDPQVWSFCAYNPSNGTIMKKSAGSGSYIPGVMSSTATQLTVQFYAGSNKTYVLIYGK